MTLQIQIYTTSHRFILIMLLEATIVSSLDYGSNFWAPIVMPPTVAKPEQLFLFISKIVSILCLESTNGSPFTLRKILSP